MSFSKSSTSDARFIQIFDAGDTEVFRLLLPESSQLDASSISVRAHGAHIDARVVPMHTVTDSGAKQPVVSLTIPRGNTSFEVLTGSTVLARMTPAIRYRIVALRDFDMVNPAIDSTYHAWIAQHDQEIRHLATGDFSNLSVQPVFSIIVPLFRTPIPYFHDMIQSVLAQTYPHWELILVNASTDDEQLQDAISSYSDARIKVVPLPENLGIAGNTNEGIRAAAGDYISFFDHDDMLDAHILEFYVQEIARDPHIDLLYCDEDNFHEHLDDRYAPLLKPDFNLDLLYSHNYVVHMLTVSRHALGQVELSPNSTSGAQDYDLTLKIVEVARSISHVPYVLYHWRAHAGSTNGGVMESKPYAIAASVEALGSHFERRGIDVAITPTDITCVFEEHYRSTPQPISVRLINATTGEVEAFKQHLAGVEGTNVIDVASLQLGEAVLPEHFTSPFTLLCTPSVRFDDPNRVFELAGCFDRPEVGAVAPKLFYPDGLVQHAGLVRDEAGDLRFINQNFAANMGGGYHGYAECSCNFDVVGPDCLMVRTADLLEVLSSPDKPRDSLTLAARICLHAHANKRLCVVLPQMIGTVNAPVIWENCREAQAYGANGSEVRAVVEQGGYPACLLGPHVTVASGYPQLACERDREEYIKRLELRSKLAPVRQFVKQVIGR